MSALNDLQLKTPDGALDLKTGQSDQVKRVNIRPAWKVNIAGRLVRVKEQEEESPQQVRKGIDDLKHHRRPRYLTEINGEADPLKAKDKQSKEFTRDLIISQLYGR